MGKRWIKAHHTDAENEAHDLEAYEYFKFIHSPEWRKAKKLYKEDYCVICGSSTKLHLHHIMCAKAFPEYRTDGNYLITLCTKCHSAVHANTDRADAESWNRLMIAHDCSEFCVHDPNGGIEVELTEEEIIKVFTIILSFIGFIGFIIYCSCF